MKIKTIAFIAALVIPSIAYAEEPGKTGATTSKSTDKTATTDKTDKPAKPAKLVEGDIKIIAHQHQLDLTEINMGKLAQRSGGAAVKSYGEMLVRDHSAADKETVAFAKKHGLVKIPADKAVTEDEKAEQKMAMESTAKLKKLKGAEFDREFATMMQVDHDKEVVKITAAIATATDPDLTTMLRDKQPVLQRHADQARELLKNNASASTSTTSSTTTTASNTTMKPGTSTTTGTTTTTTKPKKP